MNNNTTDCSCKNRELGRRIGQIYEFRRKKQATKTCF